MKRKGNRIPIVVRCGYRSDLSPAYRHNMQYANPATRHLLVGRALERLAALPGFVLNERNRIALIVPEHSEQKQEPYASE